MASCTTPVLNTTDLGTCIEFTSGGGQRRGPDGLSPAHGDPSAWHMGVAASARVGVWGDGCPSFQGLRCSSPCTRSRGQKRKMGREQRRNLILLGYWVKCHCSAWGRHWQADPYRNPEISEVTMRIWQLRLSERLAEADIRRCEIRANTMSLNMSRNKKKCNMTWN